MGGGASSQTISLVEHLMPLYYVQNAEVSEDELKIAKKSWKHITDDTSPAYISAKLRDPPIHSISCLAWMYETFYDRLFDVHPSARPLFKNNMVLQGRALCNMIGMCLGTVLDRPKLTEMLTKMTKMHSKKGVMAFQYGIMGECLMWSLERVLGFAFDEKTRVSWVKIYSIMLGIIIPVAVQEERNMQA